MTDGQRGKNLTIVSSFVWTRHRNVTDGQTDRQTDLLWLLQRYALRGMRTRCNDPLPLWRFRVRCWRRV